MFRALAHDADLGWTWDDLIWRDFHIKSFSSLVNGLDISLSTPCAFSFLLLRDHGKARCMRLINH